MQRFAYVVALGFLISGCKKKEESAPPPAPTPTPTPAARTPTTGSGSAKTAEGSGSAAGTGSAAAGSGSAAAGGFDPGTLSTPESVYYDEARDMYLVSNINGKPAEA